jgi:hypothetical protein
MQVARRDRKTALPDAWSATTSMAGTAEAIASRKWLRQCILDVRALTRRLRQQRRAPGGPRTGPSPPLNATFNKNSAAATRQKRVCSQVLPFATVRLGQREATSLKANYPQGVQFRGLIITAQQQSWPLLSRAAALSHFAAAPSGVLPSTSRCDGHHEMVDCKKLRLKHARVRVKGQGLGNLVDGRRATYWRAPVKETHGVGRSSSRKLSALLPPPQRLPLAFVGQAVTNRIANATYVLDLGLQRPAVLANSNFVILQPC